MDGKAKFCLQVKSGFVKLMAMVLRIAHAAVLVKKLSVWFPRNVAWGFLDAVKKRISQEAESQEDEKTDFPASLHLKVPKEEDGQADAQKVHQCRKSCLRVNAPLIGCSRYGRFWEHTSLCLDDDFQGRACDATCLDFPIPRTVDGDTFEQDDHKSGRADDCEESDEEVCVLVEFLMCGRYET